MSSTLSHVLNSTGYPLSQLTLKDIIEFVSWIYLCLRDDITTALDQIHITDMEKSEWLWQWYHSLTAAIEGERRVDVQKDTMLKST